MSLSVKRLENIDVGELEKVLSVSGQTVWVVALDGTILDAIGALDTVGGLGPDDLIGRPLTDIVDPEDIPVAARAFQSIVDGTADARNFEIELRVVGGDATRHDVRVHGSTVLKNEGEQTVVLGLTSDITRQKMAERALERERTRFYRTFQQAPTGIVLVHIDPERGGLIKAANAEACRLAGRSEEELVGEWLTDGKLTEIDEDALRDSLASSREMLRGGEGSLTLYRILKHPGGSRIHIRIVVSPLEVEDWEEETDKQPVNAIAHIEDVTEQRKAEGELQHQATHDSLTNLLNRRHFISLLSHRLAEEVAGKKGGALLMIDLDDFKRINDAHGHIAGDGVLKEIAWILSRELRDTDLVARLGGDEFAVLLTQTDIEGVHKVAASLQARFESSRIEVGDIKAEIFQPSVSIGGIMLDGRGIDAEAALGDCDRAMYEAKRQGGGRFVIVVG